MALKFGEEAEIVGNQGTTVPPTTTYTPPPKPGAGVIYEEMADIVKSGGTLGKEETDILEKFDIAPPPPPPPPPPSGDTTTMSGSVVGGYTEVSDPKLTTGLDMQANPLPSLPSISNVGSVPFTGTVSTIPGGFQPLPQTAGGRKKLYQLSKFHGGINQKSSPRDISDMECQEASNLTVSQIGIIKLLGDCKNENNTVKEFAAIGSTARAPLAGYGLFEFTAPSSLDFTTTDCDLNSGSAIVDHDADDSGRISVGMLVINGDVPPGTTVLSVQSGTRFTMSADATGSADPATIRFSDPKQYTILLTTDGDQVDALDSNGTRVGWMDFGGSGDADTNVAPIFYAAGNGVYVADANFTNANPNIAKIYVHRKDYDSSGGATDLVMTRWQDGKALIDSPTYDAATGGGATADNQVAIDWDDGGGVGFTTVTTAGAAVLHISSSGTGLWTGDYLFYISWLFDGGVETGLTALQTQIAAAATGGKTFLNEQLNFNFSVEDLYSTRNPIGGNIRIDGARIYFKKVGDTERFLLAEVSLVDGIKGTLDSTFIPWDEPATDTFDLAANMVFDAPPEVYTYASLNGYYANEVYNQSPDILADATVGPVAKDLRYKAVVVGSGGIVFIGNVRFNNRHMPDSMMFSMPGKPGVFPQYNRFDSPSSDGSPITALAAYRDTILQFKQNGMYVINVSNPSQFYAQASFRDCGVFNPCQVFTTAFGVIFANKNGCYIYDGQKVTSLTDGKFKFKEWELEESSSVDLGDPANTPCVGYDPRSQNIIVLKDVGFDVNDPHAWVYNMPTQSWTEGIDVIVNTGGADVYSNFIITNQGYLSIKFNDDPTLLNYNHDKSVDTGNQTINYTTKDLDFGFPSQQKSIFKVYVTYFSDNSYHPTLTYGKDGAAPTSSFTGDFEDTGGLQTSVFTTASLKGIYSLSLKIAGVTDHAFEIQDIAILYRLRPIK